MDEGKFHVETLFLLMDSGGARGEGATVPLGLVRHEHDSGADYQAPEDAEVQQEQTKMR